MSWKFNNESPIYLQIMEEIKLRIAKGTLAPGDKVPPVRELAMKAGVNPNTMQKALSELEREGVLVSQRTAGRFVAEPEKGTEDMKKNLALKHVTAYFDRMEELGYTKEQALDILETYLRQA